MVAVASDERDAGERAAQLCRHALPRFDGDDLRAAGVQQGGGYAGAGTDVRDPGTGEGATGECLDRVEEGGWVGGAVRGVLDRGGVEGVGASLVPGLG